MGDPGEQLLFASGAQHGLASGAQHGLAELSFLPRHFQSLDFLQRQSSFGFSPGTSPAANDIKNEAADSFFDSKMRALPAHQSTFLPTEDFRAYPPFQNPQFNAASSPSVNVTSRPRVTSTTTTTKQKHGQLTPPSETTSTDDNPPAEALHESLSTTIDTQDGPTTRKRRSTQSVQAVDTSIQPTSNPRRRKKSALKQSSAGSTCDGDDKRNQFLERNRVAASKCRQKKKEWTSNLEQRARELQASKNSLALLVSSLREELLYLKGEALRHTTCDCTNVREYLARHAEASFPGGHLDFGHSPHSGSDFSFEAMDLDPSVMNDSPNSSTLADNQDLPELDILGQIPD